MIHFLHNSLIIANDMNLSQISIQYIMLDNFATGNKF